MIAAHQGDTNIPSYLLSERRQPRNNRDKYPTWDQRLQSVLDALTEIKNTATSLLHASFSKRLAADPEAEYRTKIANKSTNVVRDVETKVGTRP